MCEVHINRKTLTEDELVSPLWDTCNIELWALVFKQRQELELARHDIGLIVLKNKNLLGHEHRWVSGRGAAQDAKGPVRSGHVIRPAHM
jgi:hypothetical protein